MTTITTYTLALGVAKVKELASKLSLEQAVEIVSREIQISNRVSYMSSEKQIRIIANNLKESI